MHWVPRYRLDDNTPLKVSKSTPMWERCELYIRSPRLKIRKRVHVEISKGIAGENEL